MTSTETKALDWWQARNRGERLPAHELRCDLCAEPATEDDRNEVADMIVCPRCLEEMIEATPHAPY